MFFNGKKIIVFFMSVKKIITHRQKSYIKVKAGPLIPAKIKAHQKTGGTQT